MVCADQVTAPSPASFFNVGMELSAITAGFPPSKLTIKTWSASRFPPEHAALRKSIQRAAMGRRAMRAVRDDGGEEWAGFMG
jgi:hypothetical protein